MDRTLWDQRLARYQALYLLYRADDEWGHLFTATWRADADSALARMATGEERAEWEAAYGAAYAAHEEALKRHMEKIYDPLCEAGLELVRTPAPDLAAVRIKHEAMNADIRLQDYEDEEGELFRIFEADVRRIMSVDAA